MLKALIQFFAEKFFTSKRETVQTWNFPKVGNQVTFAPTAGQDFIYTPPANGYVQIILRNGPSGEKFSVALYTEGNGDSCPRTQFQDINGWFSLYIPVLKGKTLTIQCSRIEPNSEFAFHPYY